jgi:hypothetical protein
MATVRAGVRAARPASSGGTRSPRWQAFRHDLASAGSINGEQAPSETAADRGMRAEDVTTLDMARIERGEIRCGRRSITPRGATVRVKRNMSGRPFMSRARGII